MMDVMAVLQNLVLHLEAGGTYKQFRTDPHVPMTKNERQYHYDLIDRILAVHAREHTRQKAQAQARAKAKAKTRAHK